jgi:hypothetical protein
MNKPLKNNEDKLNGLLRDQLWAQIDHNSRSSLLDKFGTLLWEILGSNIGYDLKSELGNEH